MVSQIVAWPPEAMAVIDDLSRKCLFQRKLIIQISDKHAAERELFVEKFRQYREQVEEYIKKLQTSYAETLIDLISNRENILSQLQCDDETDPQRNQTSEQQPSLLLEDDHQAANSSSYRQLLAKLRAELDPSVSKDVDLSSSVDVVGSLALQQHLDTPLSKLQEQFVTSLLQHDFNDQVRCIAEEYRLLLRESTEKYTEAKLSLEQVQLALRAKESENTVLRAKLKKYIMMDGGLRKIGNEVVNFNSIVSNALSGAPIRTSISTEKKNSSKSRITRRSVSLAAMGRSATVGSLRFSDPDIILSHATMIAEKCDNGLDGRTLDEPMGPKPEYHFRKTRHRKLIEHPDSQEFRGTPIAPTNSIVINVPCSSATQLDMTAELRRSVEHNAPCSLSATDYSQANANTTVVRCTLSDAHSGIMLEDLQSLTDAERDTASLRLATVAVGDEIPYQSISITTTHDFEIRGEQVVLTQYNDPLLTCPNPDLKSSMDSLSSLSTCPENSQSIFQSIGDTLKSLLVRADSTSKTPKSYPVRSTIDSCETAKETDDKLTDFCTAQISLADAKAQRLRMYHLMRSAVNKQTSADEDVLSQSAVKLLKDFSAPPNFSVEIPKPCASNTNNLQTGLLLQVDKCALKVENEAGEIETQVFYDKKIHTSVLPFLMSTNITHRQLIERLSLLEKRRKEHDSELVNSHALMSAAIAERREAVLGKERLERQMLAVIKERDVLMQSYENRLNSLQFNLKDSTERATVLHRECAELGANLQAEKERYFLLEEKYDRLATTVREDVLSEMKQIENATIGRLQADIVFYKDNLQLSEARIIELARINTRLEQTNSELKVDVLKQTLHKDQLKQRLRDELIIEYGRRIHTLEEQIEQDEKRYNEKLKEVGELTDAIYRLRADLDFLTEENAHMHVSMHSLSTEMADMVQKHHTSESDRRALYVKYSNLQQEATALRTERDALATELTTVTTTREEQTAALQQIIDAYRVKYLLALKRTTSSGKDADSLCLMVEKVHNHANSVLLENAKELEELNDYSSRLKELQNDTRQQSRCSYDSFSFSRDNRSASGLFCNKHVTINLDQLTEIKETPLSRKVFKSENLNGSDVEDVFQSPDGSTISDVSTLCDKDLSIGTSKQDVSAHQALLQHRRRKSVTVNSGIVVTNQTIGLTYSGLKVESAVGVSGVAALGVAVQTEAQSLLVTRGVNCRVENSMETIGIQVALPLVSVLSDSDLLAEAYDQVERLRMEKRVEADSHGAVMKTARDRMQSLETELLSQVHTKETLAATVADLKQQLDTLNREYSSYRQQHESASMFALQTSPSGAAQTVSIAMIEKLSHDIIDAIANQEQELLRKISLLSNHLSSLLDSRIANITISAGVLNSPQLQGAMLDSPRTSTLAEPLSNKATETSIFIVAARVSCGTQTTLYSNVVSDNSNCKKIEECGLTRLAPPSTADPQIDVHASQLDINYELFDSATDLPASEGSGNGCNILLSFDADQRAPIPNHECPLKGMDPPANTLLSTITDTNEDDSAAFVKPRIHEQDLSAKSPGAPAAVTFVHRAGELSHLMTNWANEEQDTLRDQEHDTISTTSRCTLPSQSFFDGSVRQYEADSNYPTSNDPPCLLGSVLHTSVPQDNHSLYSSQSSSSSVMQFSFKTEELLVATTNLDEDPVEARQHSIEEYYYANESRFNHALVKINATNHAHTDLATSNTRCKAVVTIDIELNMLRLACSGDLILPESHDDFCIENDELSPIALLESLGIFEQENICKYCGAYKDLDRYSSMNIERYAVAMQQAHERKETEVLSLPEKPNYVDALEELETFSNEQKIGMKLQPISAPQNPILLDKYAHYPLMTSSLLLKRHLCNEKGGVPGKRLCIGCPIITTNKVEYIDSLNAYAFAHDYERERDKLTLEDWYCSSIRREQLHQEILSKYDNLPIPRRDSAAGLMPSKGLAYADIPYSASKLQVATIIEVLHQRLDELQRLNGILLFDNKALQVKLCEDEKMLSIIFGRSYNGTITSADILLGRPADTTGYTREDFERYRLVLRETLHRQARPKTAGTISEIKKSIKRPISAYPSGSSSVLQKELSTHYGLSVTDSAVHTVRDLVEMRRPTSLSSPVRDAMSFSHRIAPISHHPAHQRSFAILRRPCDTPIDKDTPSTHVSKTSKLTIVSTLPTISREAVALDPPPIYEDGLISRVSHAFTRRPSPSRGCSTSIQNIPPIKPPSNHQTPRRSRSKPVASLSIYYRDLSPSTSGPVDKQYRSYVSPVD
ncbi:putative Spindle pole protein [Giardia duodenalis]|uniref:Spindle pole protein n=1 Tax=Giardia intestinalis (strain ATCC 50803 / WB clone C6) TaxID=184922 RepID=A8B6D2_GIAIC|nr:putative Spindle pole protein [Giardia intestinalis]KAE8304988.1 putative Spindle pole protein [Giardia intestinalis]|eukprot:XP_001709444.1 Spindle pole protein, putative [Giardia lamblia ATCC 50803]